MDKCPQHHSWLSEQQKRNRTPRPEHWTEWLLTLWAVFMKNAKRNLRHPSLIIFQLGLPAVQILLFCICIGRDPFDIPLAVVNEEKPQYLSTKFINNIDSYAAQIQTFDSLPKALNAVKRGEAWGVIHIGANFSAAVPQRFDFDESLQNWTIEASTIRIYADVTDQLIATYMQRTLEKAFQQFAVEAVKEFDLNPAIATLPITVGKPVHGRLENHEHRGYTEYMAPGVVLSMTYVMATGLTALLFILERNDGMFERSLVTGVDTTQMMLAHAMNRVIYMVLQIGLTLIVMFWWFRIPSQGPIIWVFLLLLLQNCTGMTCGIFVSAICAHQETATILVCGLMFMNMFMSGIIWPLEAIPLYMRWLSIIQPSTLPVESLRGIISRGFGIFHYEVWIGFVVTICWLLIFILSAARVMKYVVTTN